MLYWFQLDSKNQVVQTFKDLLSRIWQINWESRVLDLESEVSQRLMLNPDWGSRFVTGIFCFHVVKPLILALLPPIDVVCLWKPDFVISTLDPTHMEKKIEMKILVKSSDRLTDMFHGDRVSPSHRVPPDVSMLTSDPQSVWSVHM